MQTPISITPNLSYSLNRKKSKYPHAKLVEALREYVATKKAGDRLDNDKVISARFGVSNVTVRAAMLDLVKEGRVIRRVGAGTFVTDPSIHQYIAIVIPQAILSSQRDPFAKMAMVSILDALNHNDLPYKLFMIPPIPGEEKWPTPPAFMRSGLTSAISKQEIRALIHINIGLDCGDWAEPLERRNTPIVGVTTDACTPYRVSVTPERSIRQAVRYLSNFGRTRLALLSWNQRNSYVGGEPETLRVFKEALRESELVFYPEWARGDVNPNDESTAWRAFYDVWTASSDTKPDGLVITDDRLFSGVTSLLLESNIKVPRDLQIVTHWNKNSGILCPFPVARYEIDPAKAGLMAAEMLQARLENPDFPPTVKYVEPEWFTEGQYDSLHDSSLPRLIRHSSPV